MALGRDDMDALLVAYLDGELDPPRRQELEQRLRDDAALKARLNALAEAGRPLRGAFDTLLDVAPRGRLETAFAAAFVRGLGEIPLVRVQVAAVTVDDALGVAKNDVSNLGHVP